MIFEEDVVDVRIMVDGQFLDYGFIAKRNIKEIRNGTLFERRRGPDAVQLPV
jgi:hypothetical protein